ncbi:NAD-dependent epimerase/dehydratase family protein [Bacillus sp. CGMCC 1.16607]|uniref:NAD-dependent epimerase/dehydratase family protein n=1 Tax=Bacillus sp. CGMCC 1.16607 TaxID=3351842 RepID=UPI0036347EDF
MKILIIGGTRFLGRFIVEEGLKRNHEITLFNRGNNKDLFPNVEQVNGNRNQDIALLMNHKWDAVIDTCGYLPQSLDKSIDVLADQVDQYVFISSISVYRDFSKKDIKEDAECLPMTRAEADELTKDSDAAVMSHYGELKALCEQTLIERMPGKSLVIRPGLIVGPYDATDRFTYWVHRVSEGGKILAPGNPNRMVQFIDVRDLAKWTIHMVEKKQTGIFNATGSDQELTMSEMLHSIKSGVDSDAEFIWAEDEFLLENEVGPWMELPLWIPEDKPLSDGKIMSGMLAANIDKALSEGLSFRPVSETAYDTLKWYKEYNNGQSMKAGMNKDKENQLLEKWLMGSK